jgi:cytidine deaminase
MTGRKKIISRSINEGSSDEIHLICCFSMGPYRKIKAIQNNVEIMKRETPCRNCRKIPNEYSNKMIILAKCCKMF